MDISRMPISRGLVAHCSQTAFRTWPEIMPTLCDDCGLPTPTLGADRYGLSRMRSCES